MISNTQAKRKAKQLFRLCREQDLLDESRVRQVAQVIAAAGRRECPAILKHFLRLVRLDLTQHTAKIESATPLPADLQAAVETSLRRRYGLALASAFASRPALIGGMRIQVGFDVYDNSVLAGLETLEKSL
jgi:F0F1-type ATP synthase delta subunit